MSAPATLTPLDRIERRIFLLRGHRIMLSTHLGELYGVSPGALMQAVVRNRKRFPMDFMFQLSPAEFANLKPQIVISSWGGLRARPYAFSEQGVAMLSSVLHSARAIRVNIEIMRTFVRLRRLLATHQELAGRLEDLEKRYDSQFKIVFDAFRKLMEPPPELPRGRIGFRPPSKRHEQAKKRMDLPTRSTQRDSRPAY